MRRECYYVSVLTMDPSTGRVLFIYPSKRKRCTLPQLKILSNQVASSYLKEKIKRSTGYDISFLGPVQESILDSYFKKKILHIQYVAYVTGGFPLDNQNNFVWLNIHEMVERKISPTIIASARYFGCY